MGKNEQIIIQLLETSPGLTDRELAEAIKGRRTSYKYINQNCRTLTSRGIVLRKKRSDGLIGNWLSPGANIPKLLGIDRAGRENEEFSEKKIKQALETFLTTLGWQTEIAWGFTHGIDIQAKLEHKLWIIEVKGLEQVFCQPVDIFVSSLGEILQRMDDSDYKYSIALPDMDQFRRLWDRLPVLVKKRTGITALFVNPEGNVIEKV